MGNFQLFHLDPLIFQSVRNRQHCIASAGNHNTPRPVSRGNGNLACIRADSRNRSFLSCLKRDHFAIPGQGLHQTAALGDQFQAVFKAEHACDACGNILAHTMPHHCMRSYAPGFP